MEAITEWLGQASINIKKERTKMVKKSDNKKWTLLTDSNGYKERVKSKLEHLLRKANYNLEELNIEIVETIKDAEKQ